MKGYRGWIICHLAIQVTISCSELRRTPSLGEVRGTYYALACATTFSFDACHHKVREKLRTHNASSHPMGRRCGRLCRPFLRGGGLCGQCRRIRVRQRPSIRAERDHASSFPGRPDSSSIRTTLWGAKKLWAGVGFALGCLGTMLGVIVGVTSEQTFLGLTRIGSWWWALLFIRLTLMGLSTLLKKVLRLLAASVLISIALG